MKIRAINEKGIDVTIDSKDITIGTGTLEDLERDIMKLERRLERERDSQERKISKLSKIWEEIR